MMRFSVTYKLKMLDQSYRMKVLSLIKQAVRVANSRYYDQIFIQSKNKIKPFSFSTYLHNFFFEGTKIHLDQITITISTPDMEFAVHAFNGLRKIKQYQLNDDTWVQSNFQLLNEPTITGRKIVFNTMSPILIENSDGKPLSPADDEYEKELNYYANLQVKEYANRELFEWIRFTPIHMKKMVVREKNRHLQADSPLYFTTYRGTFMLEGNPQDLQLIYQLGLGKRSTYFGLLDYQGEGV
jgi:CRISPR-associated endoribonuclease Cas6